MAAPDLKRPSSRVVRSAGDWRRRLLLHHTPIAAASLLILAVFMAMPAFETQRYTQTSMGPSVFPQAVPVVGTTTSDQSGGRERRVVLSRVTTATGYVATGLLALTLLIGPANILRRRRTPLSSYVRRDAGIWTAAFSVVHVIVGLQLHSGGEIRGMLGYFFASTGGIMLDNFGLGNWTGLAALLIVLLLLALSTDAALRELKAARWKDLQRLNYTFFGLVVVHALFYGALLRATSPYTLVGAVIVMSVVVAQALGFWSWRRRYSFALLRLRPHATAVPSHDPVDDHGR